jgi:hypothetical protein
MYLNKKGISKMSMNMKEMVMRLNVDIGIVNKEVRLSIIRNKHKELADKFDIDKVKDLPEDVVEYIIKPYLDLESVKRECRIKYWLYDTDKLYEKMKKIRYENLNIISRNMFGKGGTKKENMDIIFVKIRDNLKRSSNICENELNHLYHKKVYDKYYLLLKCLILIFPTYKKKLKKNQYSV